MSKNKVRTAIIGVGNCAAALVQGVQYYQNAAEDETIPGLMNPVFIATSDYWSKRFIALSLPIIGDDIKSQIGATILHRIS